MSETLGDCCTTGTIHEGVPRGSVELVAGLPTYVVGSKGDRVVVMITDVFGYDLTNTRLLADEYAGAGYYVLCPDFFSGDALPSEVEHQMIPPESAPKRGFFKAVTETASAIAQFGPWVYRHREAVSKPIIDTFFARLKLDLPSTAKIGAVGVQSTHTFAQGDLADLWKLVLLGRSIRRALDTRRFTYESRLRYRVPPVIPVTPKRDSKSHETIVDSSR